jgi:hypothetical protein
MRLQNGDLIKVKTYGGQVVARRVVDVREQTVLITTDEEYEAATKEQREPICLGFPLADMIEVVERASGSHTTP